LSENDKWAPEKDVSYQCSVDKHEYKCAQINNRKSVSAVEMGRYFHQMINQDFFNLKGNE
ncbi:hypothetical protein CN683_25465, partial [Bacillus toyonensis]